MRFVSFDINEVAMLLQRIQSSSGTRASCSKLRLQSQHQESDIADVRQTMKYGLVASSRLE